MNMLVRLLERVGAVASIGFLVFISVQLIFPLRSADVTKLEVIGTEFQAGDILPLNIESCVYYKGEAEVTYRIENGKLSTIADFSVQVSPHTETEDGCHAQSPTTLRVPEGLDPGVHRLRLDAIYHVNNMRSVSKVFYSNEFTITE